MSEEVKRFCELRLQREVKDYTSLKTGYLNVFRYGELNPGLLGSLILIGKLKANRPSH